ncbi:MAG: tetratricopeptide repeat protein [Methylocystis sp.]|nr:tetratricopeptide repeat protein [Methylocystis sp.]
MSDIFREVDEDVRRDKAANLWKRYQTPVFVTAFLIVAATGGWRYYEDNRIKAAEAANARFQSAAALARQGNRDEAIKAFEAIAKDAPKGYATLARLRAAEELLAVDKPKAIAALDAIAEDKTVDRLTQEVARLRAAMAVMEEGDRQKMELRLGPLEANINPFRYSAQEWMALDALENGDFDEAGRVFDLLITDRDAPQAMRQRAAAYQGLLRAARGAKPTAEDAAAPQDGAQAPAPEAGAVSVTPEGDGALQPIPPPTPAPETK